MLPLFMLYACMHWCIAWFVFSFDALFSFYLFGVNAVILENGFLGERTEWNRKLTERQTCIECVKINQPLGKV